MNMVNSQNEWPASSIRRDQFQSLYNCSRFREEINPEINPYVCGQLIFNKLSRSPGTNSISALILVDHEHNPNKEKSRVQQHSR